MSALLNAKVKTAQASAQVQQSVKDKKEAKVRANSVARGRVDATKRIPEIKKELAAVAESGKKSLRISIATPSDTGW